jgi:hypothetical protein
VSRKGADGSVVLRGVEVTGGRSYRAGPRVGKTDDPTWPATVAAEARDHRPYPSLHGTNNIMWSCGLMMHMW